MWNSVWQYFPFAFGSRQQSNHSAVSLIAETFDIYLVEKIDGLYQATMSRFNVNIGNKLQSNWSQWIKVFLGNGDVARWKAKYGCVLCPYESWYDAVFWFTVTNFSVKFTFHENFCTAQFQYYALHWRHNDHDGVSNHQPRGCLLSCLFGRRSKKTSKLRVTGLCAGNSPGPVNSLHKGPVTRKMFPFDDVIMCHVQLRWGALKNVDLKIKWQTFLRWKTNTDGCWCPLTGSSITLTSLWPRWRLKSPASRLFTQPFIQTQIKKKHRSSASLAFVWGIHRNRWIPRTKGQLRGKCFHLMTSSCGGPSLT